MLPMYYAPRHELVHELDIVPRKNDELWDQTTALALIFWQAAHSNEDISPEFKRSINFEVSCWGQNARVSAGKNGTGSEKIHCMVN